MLKLGENCVQNAFACLSQERRRKRYHCMIKCHLSKHKPIYIIVLRFFSLSFCLQTPWKVFSWINIWEMSDGVWQKCHFNSQFHIKYEPSFYTLISVYWFYLRSETQCCFCGRNALVKQFISHFQHAISHQLESNRLFITFFSFSPADSHTGNGKTWKKQSSVPSRENIDFINVFDDLVTNED